MEAKAAVMTGFNAPLEMQSFPLVPLEPGEVRVKITCAGVCGSDVHMWRGKDPRTPLPMIPGHEGVGEVAEIAGSKTDLFGRELKPGDSVLWERGVMCGDCYYCNIAKEPSLCPQRKTYGISYSCEDPPHFLGCYSEYLHLRAGHPLIKLDLDVSHEVLVPATCSGATAAHAVETSGLKPGNSAIVVGPGPVGLFVLAQLLDAGAGQVWIAGTAADKGRLKMAKEFGSAGVLNVDEMGKSEIEELVMDETRGQGPNVIMDCTGYAPVVNEWIDLLAPGGTYSIPGIATPQDEISLELFSTLARKGARLQGVWVSDTSHLWRAANLVDSGRFPFEKMITHKFSLEEATEGLKVTESKESIKAVLKP
ncbi:MAG: zinc-binding dehydrogenase [Candidatus Brocadiia bacterium]